MYGLPSAARPTGGNRGPPFVVSWRRIATLRNIAIGLGIFAMLLGATVLSGWLIDSTLVTQLDGSLPVMVPNTALAVLVGGTGLLVFALGANNGIRRGVVVCCAVILISLGLLTFVGYLAAIDVGIDRIFGDGFGAAAHPKRASPHMAIAMIATGGALLTARFESGWRGALSTGLVYAAFVIVLVVAAGYVLGVHALRGISATNGVAPHAVLGLAAITCGIALLRAASPPAQWLARSDHASSGARTLLTASIVTPFLLALIISVVQRGRVWSPAMSLTLMAVITFVMLQYFAAREIGIRESESERLRAERTRTSSVERFLALARLAPVGVFDFDESGVVTFSNRQWREMFGSNQERHRRFGWLKSPDDAEYERMTEEWSELIANRETINSECQIRRPGGLERHIVFHAVPYFDGDGALVGYMGSAIDTTDYERLADAADHLVDPVTGLGNYQRLAIELQKMVDDEMLEGEQFALLVEHLDGLEKILAATDRRIRDAVLVATVNVLRDMLREDAVAAYLGGEEIAVIIPGVDRQTVQLFIDELVESCGDIGVVGAAGQWRLHPRVGYVYTVAGAVGNEADLLRDARQEIERRRIYA